MGIRVGISGMASKEQQNECPGGGCGWQLPPVGWVPLESLGKILWCPLATSQGCPHSVLTPLAFPWQVCPVEVTWWASREQLALWGYLLLGQDP